MKIFAVFIFFLTVTSLQGMASGETTNIKQYIVPLDCLSDMVDVGPEQIQYLTPEDCIEAPIPEPGVPATSDPGPQQFRRNFGVDPIPIPGNTVQRSLSDHGLNTNVPESDQISTASDKIADDARSTAKRTAIGATITVATVSIFSMGYLILDPSAMGMQALLRRLTDLLNIIRK